MPKITRAIISVSDKTGIVELASALSDRGVEILSTGGTAKAIREGGVEVKDVSEHTGFPEMMDGRVKTLHPKVHGGLLGRRDNPGDIKAMEDNGILPIDMIVVNLYPFEQTVANPDVVFEDAIENIDIGGPTMLRSAAKNFKDVTVVVDPRDYAEILEELDKNDGEVGYEINYKLARKVFEHTSRYDTMIAEYLNKEAGLAGELPAAYTTTYKLNSILRYGENPHQQAAAYTEATGGLNIFEASQLQGKEMSFNNYYDTNSALLLALEFSQPSCAIIKHNNPCGVAIGDGAADAYVKAHTTDPSSAFGGVLAFNCPVDGDAAKEITQIFIEVIIAPDFTDEALSILSTKPNIRLLKLPDMTKPLRGWDVKRVAGGVLVQSLDTSNVNVMDLKSVTKRQPTTHEHAALAFAWKVVKHVKSNAIVYANADRTTGIGIGQTSRVYAVRAGAINANMSLEDSVVASDGFLPFRDSVDGIRRMGVRAIIQPGGSIKDDEVIEAANEHDMTMLMTNQRHFKH